jgi:hypothetical protein
MSAAGGKVPWEGEVLSVQPRIRLLRSFDERSHSYLGFVIRLRGKLGGEARDFSVAVGKATQAKHGFRAGDVVSGVGIPVPDPRKEVWDLYRASGLRVSARGPEHGEDAPPYLGAPPALEVYRTRGHRRLSANTFRSRCRPCLWGCEMPVEIIIDHWNPSKKKHRTETFCYGPKSCPSYSAGPTRKVPGRRGMTWEEEDWVDEQDTAHRGPDE